MNVETLRREIVGELLDKGFTFHNEKTGEIINNKIIEELIENPNRKLTNYNSVKSPIYTSGKRCEKDAVCEACGSRRNCKRYLNRKK